MIEEKQYNLNEFNTILFDNFNYKLNQNVYDIIDNLTVNLGIKVISEKKDCSKSTERRSRSSIKKEDEWQHIKPFKSTIIIENKDSINEIRSCLNKISNKNYETNKDKIIDLMNSLVENPEELEKVANFIFDIASTNRFFSKIYADLYKCLIERFNIFRDIIDLFLEKFTDSIKNIKYVDQKDDYDEFCKYNKTNDSRKGTSVFIVNLVKKNVLEKDVLLKFILEIQTFILENIDIENKVNEIDEITENLYLLVSESILVSEDIIFMKISEECSIIMKNIKLLSSLKAKEKKSLSSRAIFKYMDIMDKM
jgi:hypothetical protein